MSTSDFESFPSSDKSTSLRDYLDEHGLFLTNNDLLNWHETNAGHPKSWGWARKLSTTLMISWLECFTTAISTSGTSASDHAQQEYGYSKTVGYVAFITMYLIGQAIGGIILSPTSEKFGRRNLFLIAAGLFCLGNIIIAAPHSFAAVFFGRFICGFASAAPTVVAFGCFEDMHSVKMRIWVVYFFTLAGNMGLVLGPIFGSYVARDIGWRWIFWIAAIASGISVVLSILFLFESKASALLHSHVKKARLQSGMKEIRAFGSDQHFSMRAFVTESLYRPLYFLATEPLVFTCSVICSIAYALLYGETESLTIVYTNPLTTPAPFNETNSSLAFLAILVGLVLNVIPRIYDEYSIRRRHRNNEPVIPEHKIRSFAVACPALAIGLWIFAWTIPPLVTGVHWIISMIGLGLTGFAANDFDVVLFGYITDSYGQYAASAASTLSLTRITAAIAFPLFITPMYNGLGANIATTIFAVIATLFALTPILFLGYGRSLRRKSKWALDDVTDEPDGEAGGHLAIKSDLSQSASDC